MRPINLIPKEERRAHGGGARTGPLAYIVVGALAVLLIGVVMTVLSTNQISDREDEVKVLEERKTAAVARANRLVPYADFEQVALQRTQSVSELADARFDWARVIRQLSRILPPGVYFEGMAGSAGGDVGGEGAAAGVTGPSLTLTGCARGQDDVAAFVAALKDIDGVTRVGLSSSTLAKADSKEQKTGNICLLGNRPQFEIVVAFDAAPPSPDSSVVVAATTPPAEESSESTEETPPAEEAEG